MVNGAGSRRRRAVILVGNPANPYSRAIRIGRTLVANGYDVEIAAPAVEGAAEREVDGPLVYRRYRPTGVFAPLADVRRPPPAQLVSRYQSLPVIVRRTARLRHLPMRPVRFVANRVIRWVLWPKSPRGWWHTLERELEPADLYHACGVLAIPAALAARKRDRRAGRKSRVIHDIIDLQLEGNNVRGMPEVIRRIHMRREGRWGQAADAHTAVNEVFGARARQDWRLPHDPVVVPNYPQPWNPPPGPRPDRIREHLGLPPSMRVCLFWGRLGAYVGLDEMAEAVLLVPDTALVILGVGQRFRRTASRDADPRFAGHHFTLPTVHPDVLPYWVASADVALVTLPPVSFNQRYTTPNKFLEALAAGTPMVLGPDLPTMAQILEREQAGRIAASMDPADIAAAIRSIVDLPADERQAWSERLVSTARERYSWPIAAAAYETVLRRIEELDAPSEAAS